MEQKVIATVGGHQITEAEVEAFIRSLPREQQVYASHPDFRKHCEEQLIAVYAFAKYGEEEKIDETEEFKNVMENARKDILAQMAMRKLFATVNVTDDEIKEYYEANKGKYSKGASVHAKHILVDNEEKCTELLNAITSGEKVFEDVAKESSSCPSGANGGDLGEFGRGQMVKEFEDAAFALKNKGDITEPVLSPYGWHIIKLMDRRDIKPFEQMRSEITRMMARDERGSMARNAMVAKLKNDYGFSLEESQRAKLMKLAGDLGKVDSSYIAAIHNDQSVLFSFENHSYTVADFASFLSKGRDVTVNAPDYVSTMIGYMADMEILDFEKAHLEDKYPDFRNLMNEYRDGMLLFEISNREVWEKASKDTEGLQKFFKKNRKKYKWDKPHYKGFLIQCCDAATADGIKNRIKELDDDSVIVVLNREFNTDSLTRVKVERGLFVEGDNEKIDELVFKGAPVKADEKLPIAFVSGKLLKKMPEAYTDVRGQVTADYQTYLEKVWVKKLNKKYPVEIYEDVLKTVNRP